MCDSFLRADLKVPLSRMNNPTLGQAHGFTKWLKYGCALDCGASLGTESVWAICPRAPACPMSRYAHRMRRRTTFCSSGPGGGGGGGGAAAAALVAAAATATATAVAAVASAAAAAAAAVAAAAAAAAALQRRSAATCTVFVHVCARRGPAVAASCS